MEHQDKKTTQNIKDLLKDIGESSSLFYLYRYFNNRGWSIYKNYDEKGYDILLLNEKNNRKIKIEVKTRQRIISSGKNKNKVTHFTLTEVEYRSADFVIAYWFEYNYFFIVPIHDLKETRSNENRLYKFIVSLNKSHQPNPEAMKYKDNWELIIKE